MKRINILLAILALGVMTSCEKFFTLTPNYEVPVDNLYQTAQDFDIAVVGCGKSLSGDLSAAFERLCLCGA